MNESLSGALALDRSAYRAAALADVKSADLAAINLTKSFDANRVVLKGISFEIYPREVVGLIGANGAGKSTLLRCCVGLTPIDGGTVRLFGAEPSSLRARDLRRLRAKVGFVFQQHNLVPRLSVLTNVLHGSLARAGARSWLQCMAPRQERERAMHYLDLVGLADIPGRRADQLSGGQSQRVAIARALMQEPKMLVADEPVASLDPKAAQEVMEAFVRLSERARLTFVFTSHNLPHALTYADRLLGLRDGAITLDGPAKAQSLSTLREFYDDPTKLGSIAAAAH
jgi:phosphonate transport system ATP-binding protein